jgi:SET and MYND domain-containing protein
MSLDYLPIGIGLYLEASVLDHSCRPNATIVFEGKKLLVRPIRETKNDEKITISYTNLLHPTETRKTSLREQYYFECVCEACEEKGQNLPNFGI